MDFKKFSLLIIARTAMLMMSLIALAILISMKGYHAASIFITLLVVAQFFDLIRFVSKTNDELVRFFNAVRYADFSQRFDLVKLGAGFDELGQAFSEILAKLQQTREGQETDLRHLKAIVEHVPVPLISLQQHGEIVLWNNSARRLFGTHSITKITDLEQFSQEFPQQLRSITAGERRLISIDIDGIKHQLSIAATSITSAQQHETLLSLQDIKSELDIAQLDAWQDLVRVLTHEIMNSITPITSLAKTAADLVEDIEIKNNNNPELLAELSDVSGAVQTVATRSDSLMQFVTSYRQLTRLPAPDKKQLSLNKLFNDVQAVATQNWSDENIKLMTEIIPNELDLLADSNMLQQILINLLKNAEQALSQTSEPKVTLTAYLNRRGHVVIEISDNGSGINEEIQNKIFVPFFTTKQQGSGVGLALTRQIMIAHNGHISASTNREGGASFKLTF